MAMDKEKISESSMSFPDGLKVLLVDSDTSSLEEITRMCQCCKYEVTIATTASEVLSLLGKNIHNFDIVISEINIRDMDAFKFFEIIALRIDLPLIVISANKDKDTVMKAYNSGACDYLCKPIQKDRVDFIWKYVVHKQTMKANKQSRIKIDVENNNCVRALNSDGNMIAIIDKESHTSGSSNNNKDDMECDIPKNANPQKKPRMVWTSELHTKFVAVVEEIGIKNAVPKKILEMMNIEGITRENIASHLQKYRLHIRKNDQKIADKDFSARQGAENIIIPQMYSNNIGSEQFQSNHNQLLGQQRGISTPPSYVHYSHNNQFPIARCGLPSGVHITTSPKDSEFFSKSRVGVHIATSSRDFDLLSKSRVGVYIESSSKDVNLLPKSSLDVHITSSSREVDLSQQMCGLGQFSNIRIRDEHDYKNLESSWTMERPSKIQKLGDNIPDNVHVTNEGVTDEAWRESVQFPFSTFDASTQHLHPYYDLQNLASNGISEAYDLIDGPPDEYNTDNSSNQGI